MLQNVVLQLLPQKCYGHLRKIICDDFNVKWFVMLSYGMVGHHAIMHDLVSTFCVSELSGQIY